MAHRGLVCPYLSLATAGLAPARRVVPRRAGSSRAWTRTAATGETDTGVDGADTKTKKENPWALMGRSVHERHVPLSLEQEDTLALTAVADESGVDMQSLRSNLSRLEQLCPPLVTRRKRGEVNPAQLVRLALDLDKVTSSMMRLKLLLPNTDVAEMCARRPALFERGAVDRAIEVAETVRRDYPKRETSSSSTETEPESVPETNATLANALLASVPDILLVPTDQELGGIVMRANALREMLPGADIAALCGRAPNFLLTNDAGQKQARGGHAAGLESGRSYEPGVPKRKRKGADEVIEAQDTDTSQGLEATETVDSKKWLSTWHVAMSISEMRNRMPKECDVDRMLTDFPNILAMDVPALFEDLSRVYPTQNPGDVLRRDPRIAYQVRTRPQSF